MRFKYSVFLIVMLLIFVAGCGGNNKPVDPTTVTTPASSPDQMKWTYQVNAITFKLVADKKLNEYNGVPHTLMLCTYQLSNLNKFNALVSNSAGLSKLYNCTSFDPSVTQVQRTFVQPGQNATVAMDRAEGTRFVGVAAAYYDLQGGGATRTWQIPMNVTETGMLFWSDTWYAPAKLDAMIILGPHEIQKVGE
ncbi:type VI secretion system lipoprotein TssJ [Maridesulfovibrio zosterae]|uniref:type VI secretion system lipoprotein TssJ n=1 Tax=Maridesulfovibrio zosterae TaxID=82171 RepID=UPI00041BB47C|nr:type VI secretion system lipoprotein TssJ [Maridesulfovibrio zosterae]